MKILLIFPLLLILPITGFSQQKNFSVGPALRDNSAKSELASFEIAEGYQVSLFASEENGIANPIVMRWGPRGRLWVLCSLVYPQAIPTESAEDKLFILEDTNGDGLADRTVIFADGLDMPTGFTLGNGGVYLGQGQDLVFLRDTDGDDRADTREILLTGFGTGDTHQNINSLTWTPGGELLFCQGLHAFSRVETPWGIVRLDEHGVFRLRPARLQLHAFRGCSGQNPWGLSHGHWGEPFAKSNGNAVSELLPVMIHTGNLHRPLDIGGTRIKSMICEIIDSPALPKDLQGNIVIAGYFGHLVDRLKVSVDGAGHRGELLPPLWRTDHQSFRPVDVQTGPDGALYVADWYNPIIGHYQASLRHPDRDKLHGRIWRVTAKGMKTLPMVDLTRVRTKSLLENLPGAMLKERERIRIEISNRYYLPGGAEEVETTIKSWVAAFDHTIPGYERHLFEALCLFEWFEITNPALLEKLLDAREPLARAYATRVVGRWHDRLEEPLDHLAQSILDPHPRVRLEAVVAAAQFQSAEAMSVAARALALPADRFIRAALKQCAHALRPKWFAALEEGKLGISDPRQLAFLLQQTTGKDAARNARDLLAGDQIKNTSPTFAVLAGVLATQGSAADLDWLVQEANRNHSQSTPILAALVESARLRDLQPSTRDLEKLLAASIGLGRGERQRCALELAGRWQISSLLGPTMTVALAEGISPPQTRVAAIESLERLPGDPGTRIRALSDRVRRDPEPGVRQAALRALVTLDLPGSAAVAASQLSSAGPGDDLEPLIIPFLARKDADTMLATALRRVILAPETRSRIRGVLGAAGVHSLALNKVLGVDAGGKVVGMPSFNQIWINELAAEVKTSGSAQRGLEIYHRDSLACTTCHVIDTSGRSFGPDLTAVGSGVPVEILIESVVWPRRQIKEGFISTTITTKDGRVISGHLKQEDRQRIVVEDAVTKQQQAISSQEVAQRLEAGTIMPPGLTSRLTREELRDLIRFLAERKGQPLGKKEGTGD